MCDYLLKKRFKAFLEASIIQEKKVQKALEQIVLDKTPDRSIPTIKLPFRPKGCLKFNDTYGNWETFAEALQNEHKDLLAFHKKLRFSREFRKEVIGFLLDASEFESEIAKKYQASGGLF